MTDAQNIFYSSISTFYSEIFPFNPAQLNFVKNEIGQLQDKRILDIGCATGELAYRLAGEGSVTTGIDLNAELLQQAIENKQHTKLSFKQGNMLELAEDFNPQQFDAVLCFGNTLVHLPSISLVGKMLKGAHTILKPGGKLLLQLLNYDYICNEQVSSLPIIDTENIRFVRRYNFSHNSDLITFLTDLEIKARNQIVTNETELLALKRAALKAQLAQAGFTNILFYSNFNREPYKNRSLPLVVTCSK